MIFQHLTKTKSGTVILGGARWNGVAFEVTSVEATFRPPTNECSPHWIGPMLYDTITTYTEVTNIYAMEVCPLTK
jgi:hypothetical protein